MNIKAINEISRNLKTKRFKMPNAPYSKRYGQFNDETEDDKSHRLNREKEKWSKY